jgi:lipopolysaccharide biosynthesis regulator YciM
MQLGLSALDKNDTKKAIQLFKLAASKDSQYVDPAIALFQVYTMIKKTFNQAIQYFFEIKKIDSAAAVPFLVKQGVALASLGLYDAAYKLLAPYFQK